MGLDIDNELQCLNVNVFMCCASVRPALECQTECAKDHVLNANVAELTCLRPESLNRMNDAMENNSNSKNNSVLHNICVFISNSSNMSENYLSPVLHSTGNNENSHLLRPNHTYFDNKKLINQKRVEMFKKRKMRREDRDAINKLRPMQEAAAEYSKGDDEGHTSRLIPLQTASSQSEIFFCTQAGEDSLKEKAKLGKSRVAQCKVCNTQIVLPFTGNADCYRIISDGLCCQCKRFWINATSGFRNMTKLDVMFDCYNNLLTSYNIDTNISQKQRSLKRHDEFYMNKFIFAKSNQIKNPSLTVSSIFDLQQKDELCFYQPNNIMNQNSQDVTKYFSQNNILSCRNSRNRLTINVNTVYYCATLS